MIGKLKGERLYLREITIEDATPTYLSWLQDTEVSKYLDCRHNKQSIESIKEFIKEAKENKGIILLAIITRKDNKHIGNVKIGLIDVNNHNADIGIIVGNKNYWNKGYGAEAVKLVIDYAFSTMKIHKLVSSIASINISSIKIFKKVGFKLEGRIKEKIFIKETYQDCLIYGIINQEKRGEK